MKTCHKNMLKIWYSYISVLPIINHTTDKTKLMQRSNLLIQRYYPIWYLKHFAIKLWELSCQIIPQKILIILTPRFQNRVFVHRYCILLLYLRMSKLLIWFWSKFAVFSLFHSFIYIFENEDVKTCFIFVISDWFIPLSLFLTHFSYNAAETTNYWKLDN